MEVTHPSNMNETHRLMGLGSIHIASIACQSHILFERNGMAANRRSQNYTSDEKQLLVSLVDNYKDVIENKKTDKVSVRERDDSWNSVSSAFNLAFPTRRRSSEQLKQCWRNMKGSTKRLAAQVRRNHFATGGGPSSTEPINSNSIDSRVLAIVPGQINPLPYENDSDAVGPEHTATNNKADAPMTSQQSELLEAKTQDGAQEGAREEAQVETTRKRTKNAEVGELYADSLNLKKRKVEREIEIMEEEAELRKKLLQKDLMIKDLQLEELQRK